jgi:diaminopimelate decarboxylase
VHAHIGSGTDPDVWSAYVDLIMGVLEDYFPDAHTVNFGGGFKEARIPGEKRADIREIGELTRHRIEETFARTGRRLRVEFEPGTFVMANSGYALTQVIDKKKTGGSGLDFLIVNGGVNINARPLLYGSQHPFYIIAGDGRLLSSEFDEDLSDHKFEAVIVGTCCESGDSQCLNAAGANTPHPMAEPEAGDLVLIGGAGAYCSSMTPMNYNSHLQIPEVLFTREGDLKLIRKKQTLEQLLANEI